MAGLSQELASRGRVVVEGLPRAGLAYLLAAEVSEAPLLVVCTDGDEAERVANDLRALAVDVALFVGEEHVPHADVSPDPRDVAQRLGLRARILSGQRPRVIVASASALLLRWMPARAFHDASLSLKTGEDIDRDAFTHALVRAGYQRTSLVEDEGTFAVRGGVIDVYPPGAVGPLRLDLFGDEIASIKRFDPETQRTFEAQPKLHVFPTREVIFDDATVARAEQALRDYGERVDIPTRRLNALVAEVETRNYFFGIEALWPVFYEHSEPVLASLVTPETRVVLADAQATLEALQQFYDDALAERERALEKDQVALPLEDLLLDPEEVRGELDKHARLESVTLADDVQESPWPHGLRDFADLTRELELRKKDPTRGEILDPLVAELKSRFGKSQDVWLTCATRGAAERLRELLLARKIDLPIRDKLPKFNLELGRKRYDRGIAVAALSSGIDDTANAIAILTELEIFGAHSRVTKKRAAKTQEGLTTLRDLRDGDFVIHVDHGVGKYLGLTRIMLNGVDGDYVHLEYQDGDKLYVPIYRLNLLQQYRGAATDAKLDKLGGTRWEKAKQRVKDAVLALAHELLALQARRHALPGFALPSPDEHFRAFEATFPYEETPDQQRAIDDVLGDLSKDTPMDRLVCGDVGFGKTEVAVRAAFLTVMAKKQVAVLVPTTVLAEQHGVTFQERLGPQGVNVEVLSRFRSTKETNEILKRAAEGKVDVLIGTHRMLSSDVNFRELGLLVVDEEQRFGVKHKERIKQFRSHVHVLTLTATPIPRTMHMATVGMRDLSIIQTPPPDRNAIKTEVTRFDEPLIAEAIRRELFRGGQVFVVHNRVQSIGSMVELVNQLVPEAKVGMAHGQMSPEELEDIMVKFVHRELNVLVATAIIESGIDIPSANTMIVNRADMFGLSQLHQLRGRIGRGKERAYAYLLLPRGEKLTKDANDRLAVLKRFSDLGSGFQIASHDMDLRGAGDLLGKDQSGNIQAVGFELYTELLSEAVEQARGHKHAHAVEPDMKLPVTAVLPESYVPEPVMRLTYYQRLSQAQSDEVIFNIIGEVRDLYGDPPDEVRHLGEVMVIRRRLMKLGAVALSADVVKGELKIGVAFSPSAPLDRNDLTLKLTKDPTGYRLLPSGRLAMTVQLKNPEPMPETVLRMIREALGALKVGVNR